MYILGIETSCDETAAAVIKIDNSKLKLLSNNVASQVKLHAKWGGVVPELAARRHTEVIIPIIEKTLAEAKIKPSALSAIAVTQGPGLITALQVGVETAKTLAMIWKKPLIGVNHIAGHIVSPFLAPGTWPLIKSKKTWPAVTLVVSGGHTEIYLLNKLGKQKLLGKTLDDAAGEAFDKVAKMLKLPYPGGPQVSKLAQTGNPAAYKFPRPMINRKEFDFSFAGLKTAVLYTLDKINKITPPIKKDICASFEQAVIEVLTTKTFKAAKEYKAKTILLAGGVSANKKLRDEFKLQASKMKINLMLSPLEFTGDNATMIALAGAIQYKNKSVNVNAWRTINANANWELW